MQWLLLIHILKVRRPYFCSKIYEGCTWNQKSVLTSTCDFYLLILPLRRLIPLDFTFLKGISLVAVLKFLIVVSPQILPTKTQVGAIGKSTLQVALRRGIGERNLQLSTETQLTDYMAAEVVHLEAPRTTNIRFYLCSTKVHIRSLWHVTITITLPLTPLRSLCQMGRKNIHISQAIWLAINDEHFHLEDTVNDSYLIMWIHRHLWIGPWRASK